MPDSRRKAVVEDGLVILGLVTVQLVGAAYMVFLSPVLSLGIKPLFLVTFGSFVTAALVFPFAVAFEREKWPSGLSPMLMARFLLLALGGVTTFQALLLLGVKKTSPSIASAMPNLAPGIIFIIAACLRFEKVEMMYWYSRAKILGTLLCLGGAVAMSFLQSPSVPPPESPQRLHSFGENLLENTYKDWVIGCLCLLGAVLVISCTTVLQAATMMQFEAPLTLCSITSLLGAFLTAAVQFVVEGRIDIGNPVIKLKSIVAIAILGGMTTAACIAFQTWAVKRKGPVFVSMFSPVQTVCSGILSALVLHQMFKVESLMAMFCMFSGLYMVLWAKGKEDFLLTEVASTAISTQLDADIEKPLLS
ncbi:unnamed protein product [Musa textilis]